MTEGSLRERSKARRQAAIERAALTLIAERGYDQATVARIADAAEVSPRTVSLYFPAKLDLALSYNSAAASRLTALLADSSSRSVFDTLRQWLLAEVSDHGDLLALQQAVFAANPSLRGTQTAETVEAQRLTAAALADQLARPSDDPVVRLVGAAMGGLIAALLEIHVSDGDLDAALYDADRLLRGAIEAVA